MCPDFVGPFPNVSAPCNRLQTKELTLTLHSFYKTKKMTNKQTQFLPEWRQLCQAALFETDPLKLVERIAHARNAVLDRIEDGYTKPLNDEQHDLRDALTTLDSLRRITERQNGNQSKAS